MSTNKIDLVRAEIERRISRNKRNKVFEDVPEKRHQLIIEGQLLGELKRFIDSLQEGPVSEDLEKAAKQYEEDAIFYATRGISNHFKAGAKWKEEQMMAKVIDATCFGIQGAALFTFRLPAGSYLVGSEVKVIVIKED